MSLHPDFNTHVFEHYVIFRARRSPPHSGPSPPPCQVRRCPYVLLTVVIIINIILFHQTASTAVITSSASVSGKNHLLYYLLLTENTANTNTWNKDTKLSYKLIRWWSANLLKHVYFSHQNWTNMKGLKTSFYSLIQCNWSLHAPFDSFSFAKTKRVIEIITERKENSRSRSGDSSMQWSFFFYMK